MLNSKKQLSDNQLENVVGGANVKVSGTSLVVCALIAAGSFVYRVVNSALLMCCVNGKDYYSHLPEPKNPSRIDSFTDHLAYKLFLENRWGSKAFCRTLGSLVARMPQRDGDNNHKAQVPSQSSSVEQQSLNNIDPQSPGFQPFSEQQNFSGPYSAEQFPNGQQNLGSEDGSYSTF